MITAAKAQTLVGLYDAPEILRVVNVWDVVSARAVAALPETKAIATAGHGIAASFGYEDGSTPRDIMIDMVGRIAAAVQVPVTADLDDGYGDAGETTRLAIGVGVVGANVEDRLKPLDESVAAVEAIVKAAQSEGVSFALNARTDAFVRAGGRPVQESIADAIQRGRAYLDAGATAVFVPGILDMNVTRQLVEGIGERKVSVIGIPGALAASEYEKLGVARISYGPLPQRVALTALQELAADLYAGGVVPANLPALN
ncbi:MULTISPECIES: isocitrate lyase/PEP mutase family protein [Microbacterium]|jgi:2-methylisocitrate lyase-like PEP mutase family enzyme|uniref:isocitrate lyase/PEP mutase family protein n=1 Tax=Microbacterium TaxID=33882 RepID=UPI0007340EDE|nr:MULTISPECIES: isocitrate lyase/phosphoenolpyruvate mutase family protein [Microbacterium]KAB1890798.1 isocitrate lyase/phosphoenolpyruvate mutase family protein [Microbacterium oxydans]KTR77711.1 phosphonomutase [Microbacterium oxydans]NYF27936.1 2-methylisocitrate lyase-like PEP mutase family enzyme [Microbacterium sp. JAI119]RBO71581.1 isocitrate lyase/phosphoenolpyruvate mutase family protein [Microbacterium sp. H6]GED39381.1 phosphonomutase [Microbacterium oxydans]